MLVCFFFLFPRRRLLTSPIRNNFLGRSGLMRSMVLFKFLFYSITSKVEAESDLNKRKRCLPFSG